MGELRFLSDYNDERDRREPSSDLSENVNPYSDKRSIEECLRTASLLELSEDIEVDSDFEKNMRSVFKKIRFSVDIDNCILFRFVDGLWWEYMILVKDRRLEKKCKWLRVSKSNYTTIFSLFEVSHSVTDVHWALDNADLSLSEMLNTGRVYFERFRMSYGGVAFVTPKTSNEDIAEFDNVYLSYVAAIISYCVDKDISSGYLESLYLKLQSFAEGNSTDSSCVSVTPAIYINPETGFHSKLGFLRIMQNILHERCKQCCVVVFSIQRGGNFSKLLDEDLKEKILNDAKERFYQVFPDNKTLSEMGRNELAFTVVNHDEEKIVQLLTQLIDETKTFVEVDGSRASFDIKVGYSMINGDEVLPEDLVRRAEVAHYQAKHINNKKIICYDEKIVKDLQLQLELAKYLPGAIRDEEFSLVFQPIINPFCDDKKINYYEALIRWEHPEKGQLPPDLFIDLAEKSGDIIQLGYWVVEEVCRCLSKPNVPKDTKVSVNLSAVQFTEPELVGNIHEIVRRFSIQPNQIVVEITENSAMTDHELTISKFKEFKEAGFSISMDDFGTGYSSLSYLLSFGYDNLKIDKSFIKNTMTDEGCAIICKKVIELAHELSLTVICEGIETKEQLAMIKAWNTDMVQGYLISKPLPWSEFYP
ncbi:GGDEF domain-containing phosphodiesterase [Parasalinivibrio latis]|uniref:putative bifunctional diguanylate cyclase/phosphodiesterase n=1 Tax=Parasalinivibrio latis TaxID=2952610 RepID=UPI0030E3C7B5